MAISGHDQQYEQARPERALTAGGSITETIGGIGAAVLSILALIGIMPQILTQVACIVLGAAILIEGGTIASRFIRLVREHIAEERVSEIVGSSLAMESLAGITGIVLGILTMLNIHPMILLPVSAIVFGAALLIGCNAEGRMNSLLTLRRTEPPPTDRVVYEIIASTTAGEVLVGLTAVTLGILALIGYTPMLLVQVAFLVLGASVFLTGSTTAARVMGIFGR